MTYIIMALLPMVMGTLAYIVGLLYALYAPMPTYAPEDEYEAWDEVLVDLAWCDAIEAEHAYLDDAAALACDAEWLAIIEAAHITLDVLYCTGMAKVSPRWRYHATWHAPCIAKRPMISCT